MDSDQAKTGANKTGSIYVVATPIGNLGDMVPRGVEILQQVDCIACEDTRRSRRLLDHFHISTPLVSLHEHNEDNLVTQVLDRVQQGESIALISDAGTPLISDPGYVLIRDAHKVKVPVVPIPGPSAAIVALSAAGLPSDRFSFEGFLPAKSGQRLKKLSSLAHEPSTLIFYEAPHRIIDSLTAMIEVFGGDREAAMARELTKTHETIRKARLGELLEFIGSDNNQQKGEFVILVRGFEKTATHALDDESTRILQLLLKELPPKRAAKLAAEITGVDKKTLYQFAVEQTEK